MALGLNTTTSGGDFLPIIKYDARAGRWFRRDRAQVDGQWTATDVDISDGFTVAFDFESCEIGWIKFGNGNPDFKLVPIGTALLPRPTDEYKQGFRLRVFGSKTLGGWREFAHTAKVVLGVIDRLHDEYLKAAPSHPGQIPVIKSSGVTPIVTGSGATKSTNYQPALSIVGWVTRPPADVKPAQQAVVQPVQQAPQAPPVVTVIQPAPVQQQTFYTEF